MIVTESLPLPVADRPSGLAAPRPDDGDGVRLFTAECAGLVWPDHGDHPPLRLHAGRLRMPWHRNPGCGFALVDGTLLEPTEYRPHHAYGAGETADYADYARRQSLYLLVVAGSAALAADVTDPDPGEWAASAASDSLPYGLWGGSPAVHPTAAVDVPSWEALRDPALDPAGLWLWSTADRAQPDGRRTAKERDQALVGLLPAAVAAAQALHDVLALLLPAAVPEPPAAPTNRRSSWR